MSWFPMLVCAQGVGKSMFAVTWSLITVLGDYYSIRYTDERTVQAARCVVA